MFRVMSSVKLASRPESNYPKTIEDLARNIRQPNFPEALNRFLYLQLNPGVEPDDVPLEGCPAFRGTVGVYHSAVARFYSPSDVCGAGGMHCERIRSHPTWRGLFPRRDTVLVVTDDSLPGVRGMTVARVLLFFSFSFEETCYSCALVNWLVPVGEAPDDETGMWIVKPEFDRGGHRTLAVIHVDSIVR
ncbi:hypothetical protein H0H93_010417, partial [Arthromyces matolae]